jgi:hypothetical protein
MSNVKHECDSPPICGSVEGYTWTILGDARAVAALNAEMLAMLKRLEWCIMYNDIKHCVLCDGGLPIHKPDCELAALIAKADERV